MPHQRITRHEVGFGRLRIAYDDRVLHPRPWTLLQSEWAHELLEALADGPVLELCAGPGHIGLLAVTDTDRHLVQVDASELACDFARGNARRAGMTDRVEVRTGLLEEALHPDERFILVIADPPWVPTAETARHPEDPVSAIDGGPDGLDVVRACLQVIARHLAPDGAALLQVGGADQVRAVESFVASHVPQLRTLGQRLADEGAVVQLVATAPDGLASA